MSTFLEYIGYGIAALMVLVMTIILAKNNSERKNNLTTNYLPALKLRQTGTNDTKKSTPKKKSEEKASAKKAESKDKAKDDK